MQLTKIKINQSEEFRQSAAESIVEELCGESPGHYYVDIDTWKIYFKEYDAPWSPWPDSATVIPITNLALRALDVDDAVDDWDAALESVGISLKDIIKEFRATEFEYEDESMSIEEQSIEWARTSEKYSSIIEGCENEARDRAIAFILQEFPDEVYFRLD